MNVTEDSFVQTVRTIQRIFSSYVADVVVFFGIILNLFSIYIFRRGDKGKTPAIYYYLVCLQSKQKIFQITLTAWHTGVLIIVFFHSLSFIIKGTDLLFS